MFVDSTMYQRFWIQSGSCTTYIEVELSISQYNWSINIFYFPEISNNLNAFVYCFLVTERYCIQIGTCPMMKCNFLLRERTPLYLIAVLHRLKNVFLLVFIRFRWRLLMSSILLTHNIFFPKNPCSIFQNARAYSYKS